MQEVLDTHNLEAEDRTDARKEKLEADAVWDLMGSAERIVVAKGKSVATFVPEKDDRDAILKSVLGRSGSLRAPTVKTGNTFFVGYNDALYADAPFANG
ncbi:MAG: ArsC family (seleno)protein [Candidatus Poribacteria bacterium]|nr:ArsC family (seleno)protein [Candidatus Poribacteria bacterium]